MTSTAQRCAPQRRTARLLPALALAGLVAAGGPAAAQDLEVVVELSTDRVTWAESLDAPLFDPAVRWVPGDARTAGFWLRHRGPSGADVDVEVLGRGVTALYDSGSLLLEGRAAGGAWQDLGDAGTTLLNSRELPAGRAVRVDLRATMLPEAPNATMVLRTDVDLVVRVGDSVFTDDLELPGSGSGSGGGPGGGPGSGSGAGPGAGGVAGGGVPTAVDAGLGARVATALDDLAGLVPGASGALRPSVLLPVALLLGLLTTLSRRRAARSPETAS